MYKSKFKKIDLKTSFVLQGHIWATLICIHAILTFNTIVSCMH